MKKFFTILIKLLGFRKCQNKYHRHIWVYEDVKHEQMVGTGNYIDGKEIERKEVHNVRERYCSRCRQHEMEDPFGFWWPLLVPKIMADEKVVGYEEDTKVFLVEKKSLDEMKSQAIKKGS